MGELMTMLKRYNAVSRMMSVWQRNINGTLHLMCSGRVEECSAVSSPVVSGHSLYANFVHAGDLCFDIGANVGGRADVFLALGAKVICLEPQPNCVERLKAKYLDNPDVVVVPKGVASEPGVLELSICDATTTLATFSDRWKTGRFRDCEWNSTIQVPVTTLELLIQEYGIPRLCKIDVEGYEYQVIRGLVSPIPYLSFEFTKEFTDDAKACVDYLESLGEVTFNYARAESPELALTRWADAGTVFDRLRRDSSSWGDIYARFDVKET